MNRSNWQGVWLRDFALFRAFCSNWSTYVQGSLSSSVFSPLSLSWYCVQINRRLRRDNSRLAEFASCLLRFVTIFVFYPCCCWLVRHSSGKKKIRLRNKSSWLVPRYISEQPNVRDNVRVLQGGWRSHNHGEQTGPKPDSDPGPDSEYGKPPRNCRGSSSRSPR